MNSTQFAATSDPEAASVSSVFRDLRTARSAGPLPVSSTTAAITAAVATTR